MNIKNSIYCLQNLLIKLTPKVRIVLRWIKPIECILFEDF